MSAPQLDRQCAREILALVDAARAHAPGSELAWLVGWAMRASGEPVAPEPRHDTEPGGYSIITERRADPKGGHVVAKVKLEKRPER